jgi:opacity protein-like surface antigen
VFRSKQKLDSDLAARSSSLARIYSDLGFQELALVEGWKAVNNDPTNHSAHRFLADSYSARPRHEISRVSELLQSQLLQPLNMTPIQPRLAESNLFLISGQGPGSLSFNEFNPIFNRNGANVQFSTLVGEHDTIGGELVLAAIQNRLSWSLGYTLFDTDGWRDNADQEDQIANVFVQYELTYKTSIQAEYRYRDTESGDTQLRFFEDDFLPNLDQREENQLIRLGFRHAFAPGSNLLGNFMYQHGEFDREDDPVPGIVNTDTDSDADDYSGELSYLLRSNYINLVTGAGYFDIDAKSDITTTVTPPFPPITIITTTRLDGDVEHANGYLYSYIDLPMDLTLTIGGSYDDFDADDEDTKDRDQFNPKFGITWNPFSGTTLRGAAFRVLTRTLITDQTLEPTQVAGFNQFYDDSGATDSWLYGGAIDQKCTQSIYGGVEYTFRDSSVPFNDVSGPTNQLKTVDWDEKKFRSYLFWTPHDWVALRAEYLWERFERDEDFGAGVKTVETQYVPLGINFFHPIGLSAGVTGTYVDQQGSFNRQTAPPGTFENGKDDFWLVDAAIKYRFPKRYGFFTVGVRNLTDEDFEYWDSDIENPRIQPDRFFFASFTLAVP